MLPQLEFLICMVICIGLFFGIRAVRGSDICFWKQLDWLVLLVLSFCIYGKLEMFICPTKPERCVSQEVDFQERIVSVVVKCHEQKMHSGRCMLLCIRHGKRDFPTTP